MERKIGEIFEYNGEWYQCVEDTEYSRCINCCFYNGGHKLCTDKDMGNCAGEYRRDAKYTCFKKLEKVGEPFERNGYMYQEYKAHTYPLLMSGGAKIPTDNGFAVVIKQNKEDMEEQHSTENYPKEDEVATRIANKVGEDIRDQLEKNLNKEDMEKKKPTYEELLHYYDSTVGLWAIDRSPQEVGLDWICDNAFQLGIDEETLGHKINKLKEFDLEAAKAGKPVCTRDGRKARIICFDRRDTDNHCIVALIEDKELPNKERVRSYFDNGKYLSDDEESVHDLMMLPEKKEGWVNVYKGGLLDTKSYNTKKEAFDKASPEDYVDTIKINWSE